MEFAVSAVGDRVRAQRGALASCPSCAAIVHPKCGLINVHHWAHEARDCDPWSEPETRWHRYWKHLLPAEQREVIHKDHRADILRRDQTVVELQHSTISVEEIRAREAAYGRMVWLFDGRSIPPDRLILRPRGEYVSFRWKHPRKHYAACACPVYIDLSRRILRLRALHLNQPPYGGWGTIGSHRAFTSWLLR